MQLSEREQLLAGLAAAAAAGEPVVLVTVVGADGSVYRRIGARMLIRADGSVVGAISGGCLEAEVLDRAREATASGRTLLERYDTRDQDDAVWGSGIGCQGIVEVLVEPISADRVAEAAEFYAAALSPETRGVLATLVRGGGPGARIFVTANGMRSLGAEPGSDWEPVIDEARSLIRGAISCVRAYPQGEGEWQLSLEVVDPPVRLLVLGGGIDAVPLTTLARALGWRVRLVDHRAAFALPERFPAAEEVICSEPERLAPEALEGCAAAVVVTHSFPRDRIYLDRLLKADLRYIGLLGPRRRTERLLADLGAEGKGYSADALERIHGPVGLDLGAETPETIALSIVAEVQAALAGRGGGPLRNRWGPIHERGDAAAGAASLLDAAATPG
jgi:xanthine dehydrogenase accessory factor